MPSARRGFVSGARRLLVLSAILLSPGCGWCGCRGCFLPPRHRQLGRDMSLLRSFCRPGLGRRVRRVVLVSSDHLRKGGVRMSCGCHVCDCVCAV